MATRVQLVRFIMGCYASIMKFRASAWASGDPLLKYGAGDNDTPPTQGVSPAADEMHASQRTGNGDRNSNNNNTSNGSGSGNGSSAWASRKVTSSSSGNNSGNNSHDCVQQFQALAGEDDADDGPISTASPHHHMRHMDLPDSPQPRDPERGYISTSVSGQSTPSPGYGHGHAHGRRSAERQQHLECQQRQLAQLNEARRHVVVDEVTELQGDDEMFWRGGSPLPARSPAAAPVPVTSKVISAEEWLRSRAQAQTQGTAKSNNLCFGSAREGDSTDGVTTVLALSASESSSTGGSLQNSTYISGRQASPGGKAKAAGRPAIAALQPMELIDL